MKRESIFRRLRPAVNLRPEDVALGRAREEVGRMRRTFELRESKPPHVSRAYCPEKECRRVVELVDGRCPCGNAAVDPIVPARWTPPKKAQVAA